jgi:subtilisin family serine protease
MRWRAAIGSPGFNRLLYGTTSCAANHDRRLGAVVRARETDAGVLSAQPNYLFALIGEGAPVAARSEGDPSQYILDKMHLPQAHELAKGDKVLVAVIDSGVDVKHPDLSGDIAGSFDAIGSGLKVHSHGTAIAGAIAAHGRLMGAAPAAQILAIRAFSGTDADDGTTFAIMTGLNWAVSRRAHHQYELVGPQDPGYGPAAHQRALILVAAIGNRGQSRRASIRRGSERHCVTATDANDQMPLSPIEANMSRWRRPASISCCSGPMGPINCRPERRFRPPMCPEPRR